MILGGRFKIIRKIGEGATSLVYLAEDFKDNKIYALKILKSEIQSEKNVKAYELAKTLSHPGIVRVYETGKIDGKTFILTEFVDGKSLDQVINTLKEDEKEQIAKEIIEALAYAHNKGVIHRDLKPQNILVTDDHHAKLTDFGLLRAEESTMTMTGEIAGTPAYISPEELKGEKPTFASDIFSLGTVLYELFTGEHPFKGESISSLLYSILNENPKEVSRINREVPERISKIISKCLIKTPDFRYKNAVELLKDWESNRKIKIKDPARSKKYKLAMPILLLVLLILSVFLILKRENGTISSVKITGSVISAYDKKGHLLFKKETGSDITASLIVDIDKDGKKEALVGTHFLKTLPGGKRIPGRDTAVIYCFSKNGKIKWTYKVKDKIIYNKPDILVVDRLLVPENMQNRLIIGARAGKWFPYLLKFIDLNANNAPPGTFWNSGWVFDITALDINDDSVPDIIAGGVNNDLGMKPVVFALNGKDFQAQSPPWLGKEISEEHGVLFYTLLPGSDPVNDICSVKNGLFKITTRNGKIFYITREGILLKDRKLPENTINIINTQNTLLKRIKAATDLSREEKINDAISEIDRVLQETSYKYRDNLYPLYAYLHLYRGILRHTEGFYQLTIQDFKKSASLDREFAAPWLRLGFVYFRRLLFEKAAEYFRKSYRLNYDQWAYFYSMLSYALSGNAGEALSMHKIYAKKDDAFYIYFSSLLFYITGEADSALYYEQLMTSKYPEVVEDAPYIKYAVMVDRGDKIQEKDTVFLKKYPDLYGTYLYRKGRFKKAVSVLVNGKKEILKDISALSFIQLWRTYYYLYLIYQQTGLLNKMRAAKKNFERIKIKPVIKANGFYRNR